MIFRNWKQVLNGTKTQTRRPVKEGEELFWIDTFGSRVGTPEDYRRMGWDGYRPPFSELAVVRLYPLDGHIYLATGKVCPHRIKWQVGRTYAVQPGRGKKAVGRIRITKIRRERLQHIDINGVLAEGISLEEIKNWQGKDHPESFMHFSPAQRAFQGLWDSIYRKPYRWKDNPDVWVLEFELAEGGICTN